MLNKNQKKIENKQMNLLINGENYIALDILNENMYDLILIDPPYCTNNKNNEGFLYKDNFPIKEWENNLKQRIEKSYKLLKNTGCIAVHIDDKNNHKVRNILDCVFGESNFVNNFHIKRITTNLRTQFKEIKTLGNSVENLIVYKKTNLFKINNPYKKNKSNSKIHWRNLKTGTGKTRPTMQYDIEGISLTKGQWRFGKERCIRALKNYKEYIDYIKTFELNMNIEEYYIEFKDIYKEFTGFDLEFVKREADTIKFLFIPKEYSLKTSLIKDDNDIEDYKNNDLTDWIVSETTKKAGLTFLSSKNLELTKYIIDMLTPENGNVLDYYGGSGTTAVACMQLNKNLKFTLITNNENNIFTTICKPRILSFADKLNENIKIIKI